MKKISTEPYKGTRDFYPSDMALQKYIFKTMNKVVEKYGYQEYAASLMEESELYRSKSGEEIVNEQTYTFTDRGGRDVTLRPEMTPTVARMVANKRKQMNFPVRWYSIPNCFRYERPQRGRLREFWQLNVDLLGLENIYSDMEIIQIASNIMTEFGANTDNFIIRVNSRKLMNEFLLEVLKLNSNQAYGLSKLIDRKNKMPIEEFEKNSEVFLGSKINLFLDFLKAKNLDELPEVLKNSINTKELNKLLALLKEQNISNFVFDPTLMRGFDYYTGIVFEVFDTNPVNSRSLFGGGRYDNLVDMFGVESVPAVGFGMGDVTIQDYLETYNLTPKTTTAVDLTICTIDSGSINSAIDIANKLRKKGVNVLVDYSDKKIGQKIKSASQNSSKYLLCLGEKEIKEKIYNLKNLQDFSEEQISEERLLSLVTLP
jgi:histidyl-tRNA synthetase